MKSMANIIFNKRLLFLLGFLFFEVFSTANFSVATPPKERAAPVLDVAMGFVGLVVH